MTRDTNQNNQIPVELLIFPYAAAEGRSLLHLLIEELGNGQWDCFQAAVAFVKVSGNSPELLQALLTFSQAGGHVQLTFGADSFSGQNQGSDFEAVQTLVQTLKSEPTVRVYLYHERGRTFHPKVYLFSNKTKQRALLVIGSSNWSAGGFFDNVEANVVLRLDLAIPAHNENFTQVQRCFTEFWRES